MTRRSANGISEFIIGKLFGDVDSESGGFSSLSDSVRTDRSASVLTVET